MYPEFWLKNWSMPSTESAVKLQELVRVGYEHAVARAEASARMARSLSACRTPFDAIAVYQDWIVAESQRIVGDMRRMAELSKALLESTGQAVNTPFPSPMNAVADAMLRTEREESEESGAAAKTDAATKTADAGKPAEQAPASTKPAAVQETAAPSVPAQAAFAHPEPAEPASEPTPAPQPETTEASEPKPETSGETAPGNGSVEAGSGEGEEAKPRRKRKTAAAE